MKVIVLAKEPKPGRVKTRLCPPCSPDQAARLAEAALADTFAAAVASGADEVSVFGDLGQGGDGLLATYDVSAAAPDLSVPASPVVVLGEATCEACPEPLDSCCSRGDTEGRLTTAVTITTTQPGMILGWTNDGEHLAGVLTHTTYDSAPAYSGPRTRLPNGADIVAMSVAVLVVALPVHADVAEPRLA